MLYRYKVEPLDDCYGQVNRQDYTVTVDPTYLNEEEGKPIILHETIHIYESALDVLPKFYHDILLLAFYNDLKPKIEDLDDRILNHTHVKQGAEITKSGGNHDILFFLKSLDLGLRCGYKLGTVCGYGRNEF